MPRPKLPPGKKKLSAIQLRLSEAEREVFDRLCTDLAAKELRGVVVSDAGVLRWLFAKAAQERGLDKPVKAALAPEPAPSKPKRPATKR